MKCFLLGLCILLTLSILTPSPASAQGNLKQVYKDNYAIVFEDTRIDPSKTKWIFNLYSKTWTHVTKNFGKFGGQDGGRLRGEFAADSGEGGMGGYVSPNDVKIYMSISPGSVKEGNIYDKSGTNGPNQALLFDSQVRDISRIIEAANNQMEGSPASAVWGSNGWAYICVYDIFLNIGYKKELDAWKRTKMNEESDAATAKNIVVWMRDWWIPLYDRYGKTALLGRFFKLVKDNWPKDGRRYKGEMNVGQFTHFWSGAAKTDLKSLATSALGWEQEDEDALAQAKKDFPNITY